MSNNAIEKALWQACNNPADAVALSTKPEAYLGDFRIDEAERALLLNWDVAGLAGRGVSPMLLMMAFNAANPGAHMMDYITRINTPPSGGSAA